jgi:hypothetical protein
MVHRIRVGDPTGNVIPPFAARLAGRTIAEREGTTCGSPNFHYDFHYDAETR